MTEVERASLHWRGIDPHGHARTGQHDLSLTRFVHDRFDAGWRRLEVTRNGEIVGQIAKNADQYRTWWTYDAD